MATTSRSAFDVRGDGEVTAGLLAAAVLLLVPLVLWRAWALAVLWGWFAVPLGAPPVGVAAAFGLSVTAALAINLPAASRNRDVTARDGLLLALGTAAVLPAVALALGALARPFAG